LLAWLVVAGVVVVILARQAKEPEEARAGLDLLTMQLQARASIGLAELFKRSAPSIYKQLQTLDRGTYRQRLGFVVLTGELLGQAQARTQLRKLEALWEERGEQLDPADATLAALLKRLYDEPAQDLPPGQRLSDAEQQQIRRELGWFGELALAPPWGLDTQERQRVLARARLAAIVSLIAACFFVLLIVVGTVVLVLVFLLWQLGKIQGKFRCGSRHAGVYAETFAVYLLVFLGISDVLRRWPQGSLGRWGLLFSGGAALLSLAALAWPVLRGIPWHQVRHDLGLVLGPRPWLEPLLGLGYYTTAWPLLLIGLLLSFGIKLLRQYLSGPPDPFGPSGDPAHPMVQIVTSQSWLLWLQAFVVAGVIAPLVEETMFRGVLYRHLREATARWGNVGSCAASALAVSLVFAIIHPQGLQGVPILMALAFSFTLAREARGTLVPAVIAHGCNNTAITCLLLLMAL
jgi:membrane protease YdiL (CAAX protease family)